MANEKRSEGSLLASYRLHRRFATWSTPAPISGASRGTGRDTEGHVDDVVGAVWNDDVVSAPGIARRHEPLPHAAVYALALPRTRKPAPTNVRYVGQTGHPVDRRFRQHVRGTRARAVRDWIDSLDGDPVLFVLDDMPGANRIELTRREHERIEEYRAAGAALLNAARRPRYAS